MHSFNNSVLQSYRQQKGLLVARPCPIRQSCRVSVHSSAVPGSTTADQQPPLAKAKLHLDRLFVETHEEMVERHLRALQVKLPLFFTHTYYFRDPEDVWAVLSKDDITFQKSPRVAQTKEWLGNGVFSQLDPDKHTAARATLNPAFRRDYIQQLDGFMIASAQQLAALLTAAAGADDAGGAGPQQAAASSSAGLQAHPLDMQRLFRLLTLDTIGLTSLNQSFNTLQLWQQQELQPAAAAAASASSSTSSRQDSSSSRLELERMLRDLESAFMWQALRLPIPRSWLPGWSEYISACTRLDDIIATILQQTNAEQHQQHQQPSTPPAHPSSAGANNRGSSRQTLVSFLLAAQQQQGSGALSDQHICDEVKTIMFGGTDTSAFTLAMCAHNLAQHTEAADRGAAEVVGLLQQTGRSSVSQLTAADVSKLPWVQACVNETMRLAPAGSVMTRTANEDTQLAGYHIPKGMTVSLNIYAMHRHPDVWPQPDAWLPQRWLPHEAAAQGLSTRGSSSSTKAQPFLPFSTGPRGCIGRNYAVMQMVLTIAVLLGSGIRFTQAAGQPPVELVKGMTMKAKSGVWLTPKVVG